MTENIKKLKQIVLFLYANLKELNIILIQIQNIFIVEIVLIKHEILTKKPTKDCIPLVICTIGSC